MLDEPKQLKQSKQQMTEWVHLWSSLPRSLHHWPSSFDFLCGPQPIPLSKTQGHHWHSKRYPLHDFIAKLHRSISVAAPTPPQPLSSCQRCIQTWSATPREQQPRWIFWITILHPKPPLHDHMPSLTRPGAINITVELQGWNQAVDPLSSRNNLLCNLSSFQKISSYATASRGTWHLRCHHHLFENLWLDFHWKK